jgi:DNA-binding transcriptional MerR regulator
VECPWVGAHVTALVDAAGVRPTNASARAAPSARAIRFYVAGGLLERPEGTGTAATYNYRHFLQLLAIKIRQREGVTLEDIKKEMREVSGDALERRVATSLGAALGATVETRRAATDDEPSASWRRLPLPTAWSSTSATTPPPRAMKPSSPCARL